MKEVGNLQHFESFLIKKWLPEGAEQEGPEKQQTLAFQNCFRAIRHAETVSRNTLRKWFQSESGVFPKREQIIQFAFAAHFTVDMLQEYLQEGILEPGIQVNDYREMIFMYGLEHACSYKECLDMITFFERRVNHPDIAILQRTHTEKLKEFYAGCHALDREEFLVQMCEHAEYFKGYSRVALKYFIELKREIVEYAIESDRMELEERLAHLKFQEWVTEHDLERVGKEDIRRFVRNISRRKESYISQAEKNEIYRLLRTAWPQKQNNEKLLKTVYSLPAKRLPIFGMDQKKLSQILRIAENKEKEIKLSWALSCLSGSEDKSAACPQWVCKLMEEYKLPSKGTVGAAEKYLEKCRIDQRQRCHLVRRLDLLPLIHYVAQLRYDRENTGYNRERAREIFVCLANEILSDCQMVVLNEEYRIDNLFLSSYMSTEMDSFADLMEKLVSD